MLLMVERTQRKKAILDALNHASVGRSISFIASDAKISGPDPAQKLYGFRKTGYLNPDDESRLESWLKQNGYYVDSTLSIGQGEREGDEMYLKKTQECPECGELVPGMDQGHMWCGKCGAILGLVCPECSWVATPDLEYCGKCATPLTEPSKRKAAKDKEDLEALEPKKPKRRARRKKGEPEF